MAPVAGAIGGHHHVHGELAIGPDLEVLPFENRVERRAEMKREQVLFDDYRYFFYLTNDRARTAAESAAPDMFGTGAGPSDRDGSSRAEFRMNASSEVT